MLILISLSHITGFLETGIGTSEKYFDKRRGIVAQSEGIRNPYVEKGNSKRIEIKIWMPFFDIRYFPFNILKKSFQVIIKTSISGNGKLEGGS